MKDIGLDRLTLTMRRPFRGPFRCATMTRGGGGKPGHVTRTIATDIATSNPDEGEEEDVAPHLDSCAHNASHARQREATISSAHTDNASSQGGGGERAGQEVENLNCQSSADIWGSLWRSFWKPLGSTWGGD